MSEGFPGDAGAPDPGSPADLLRQAASSGDLTTLDRLVPALFDELRVLAHRQLAGEADRVTLQTTELVHEAYLRLLGSESVTRKGAADFRTSRPSTSAGRRPSRNCSS